MECRDSKSDGMDGDNKLGYQPKESVFVSKKRWKHLSCSFQDKYTTQKTNLAIQNSEQLIWDTTHIVSRIVHGSDLICVNGHVWDRQDRLVDGVKRLILEQLNGQWMGSWLTDWIYGHNSSTQGDC